MEEQSYWEQTNGWRYQRRAGDSKADQLKKYWGVEKG